MPDLAQPKFQRNVEDFTCVNCGVCVKGSGYTNHCPQCFTSMHVDIQPGDRAADCGGIMWPVDVTLDKQDWRVLLRCEKCGFERPNTVQDGDNMEALARIQEEIARKFARG